MTLEEVADDNDTLDPSPSFSYDDDAYVHV